MAKRRCRGMYREIFLDISHLSPVAFAHRETLKPIVQYLEQQEGAFAVMSTSSPTTLTEKQLRQAYRDAWEGGKFYHLITGRDVIYPRVIGEEETEL